jgi:hypothetical protein
MSSVRGRACFYSPKEFQSLPTNGISERGCMRGGGISRDTLDCSEINALRLVPHSRTAALRFVGLMPPRFGVRILLTSAATRNAIEPLLLR